MITGIGGFGIVLAFIGGVVSFASPCCLPLVPAYVSYMVGTTGAAPGQAADRRLALAHGLAFVIGFSFVFVAFFASIGLIGTLLAENARYIRQIGGAILIFLGLQTAGIINIAALWRDTRPLPAFGMAGGTFGSSTTAPGARPGYRRSLLFGAVFAAGWSPCIGPILGGIIGLASASTSVGEGIILLVTYSAGLAVPFLAVALGATVVARRLQFVGRHHRAVSLITGGLLIVIGILMLTNTLHQLSTLGSPLGL